MKALAGKTFCKTKKGHCMIMIDETKLKLLLEEKRQFIGARVTWDSFLSAASFLISAGLASYPQILGISGEILKALFLITGIGFTGKSVYDIRFSRKNNYTKEDLLQDINNLNQITHNHSIVVIKNTFAKHPNRFLVYYDERWKCYLFPNFAENVNNEKFICTGLENKLKITNPSLRFIEQKISEKYSESHKEYRIYSHRLYECLIHNFPEKERELIFTVDGIQYAWKTIEEMEKDLRIVKVNADVLEWVRRTVS